MQQSERIPSSTSRDFYERIHSCGVACLIATNGFVRHVTKDRRPKRHLVFKARVLFVPAHLIDQVRWPGEERVPGPSLVPRNSSRAAGSPRAGPRRFARGL
ncbi:uncharacterized protein MYCGRDRAFT_102794 [Zymoseptoria tritici IPO323]|uniref:Uncharacterized protein n=1 Tax=Zymoseptoria tritici (strain CBS 115943 / IPO323) TaxID=336722 RepID=F9X1F4_ZYMTI|nr:uncharacterized protein MYCGRDRAFT_102794 [Zymoseptoria tritici IPO323]EGP92062.1 hypothetical protein MYCGRDRAFT_102794 [Zymoseptoria tritici IPO323]